MLLERAKPGAGDLFILMRLGAGNTDGADAFALIQDRQTSLHGHSARKRDRCRPLLDDLFENFGWSSRCGSRLRFADGDHGALSHGAVQAFEVDQKSAIVHDGNADIPFIFRRLCFASGQDFLRE